MLKRMMLTMLTFLLIQTQAGCSEDVAGPGSENSGADYVIVDTDQNNCFDTVAEINCPSAGQAFHGQDAQYEGLQPSYVDNGDGSVSDLNTGLMWQKGFSRVEWADAPAAADAATTGDYDDWRVPTIKELYSLILFSGNQGTGPPEAQDPPADAVPFIDTDYFDFEYGDTGRYIDAQYISSTEYTGLVFETQLAFFGVNFADGRIKGYPQAGNPEHPEWYGKWVRGGEGYGGSDFIDNGDGTVTDAATELMWLQSDSGDDELADLLSGYTYADGSLKWEEALDFCENLGFADHDDWRLPNAKELHSIVDYTRSPDATGSPAIDPVFETTSIITEAGIADWPFFWSSTTFLPGHDAIYIAFGEGLGYMDGSFMDVHGAGCQRTDPKEGEPDWGHGPQGDVRRIYNYVRPVRDAGVASAAADMPSPELLDFAVLNNPARDGATVSLALPSRGYVRIDVLSVAGRRVATLVDEVLSASTHVLRWNGRDLSGNVVPSGIYFARLVSERGVQSVKLTLMH